MKTRTFEASRNTWPKEYRNCQAAKCLLPKKLSVTLDELSLRKVPIPRAKFETEMKNIAAPSSNKYLMYEKPLETRLRERSCQTLTERKKETKKSVHAMAIHVALPAAFQ